MLLTRHLDANAALVSLIEPLSTRDGFVPTALPGVQVLRASCDVARGPQIYEPSLVIIAQGSKLAYLGPRTLEYGAGHYLIQALPVPFECETFAAPSGPMLGVSVAIDRVMLGELVLAMGLTPGRHIAAQTPESMTSAVLDDAMRGCVERLLRCLHDPLECQIMGQARMRELLFVALRGPQADVLRALVEQQGQFARIAACALHRAAERRDPGQLRQHECLDLSRAFQAQHPVVAGAVSEAIAFASGAAVVAGRGAGRGAGGASGGVPEHVAVQSRVQALLRA
jgi:hypothetical protein